MAEQDEHSDPAEDTARQHCIPGVQLGEFHGQRMQVGQCRNQQDGCAATDGEVSALSSGGENEERQVDAEEQHTEVDRQSVIEKERHTCSSPGDGRAALEQEESEGNDESADQQP